MKNFLTTMPYSDIPAIAVTGILLSASLIWYLYIREDKPEKKVIVTIKEDNLETIKESASPEKVNEVDLTILFPWGDEKVMYDVELDLTVANLLERIYAWHNIRERGLEVEDLNIQLGSEELKPDWTLRKHGVGFGSAIYVVKKEVLTRQNDGGEELAEAIKQFKGEKVEVESGDKSPPEEAEKEEKFHRLTTNVWVANDVKEDVKEEIQPVAEAEPPVAEAEPTSFNRLTSKVWVVEKKVDKDSTQDDKLDVQMDAKKKAQDMLNDVLGGLATEDGDEYGLDKKDEDLKKKEGEGENPKVEAKSTKSETSTVICSEDDNVELAFEGEAKPEEPLGGTSFRRAPSAVDAAGSPSAANEDTKTKVSGNGVEPEELKKVEEPKVEKAKDKQQKTPVPENPKASKVSAGGGISMMARLKTLDMPGFGDDMPGFGDDKNPNAPGDGENPGKKSPVHLEKVSAGF